MYELSVAQELYCRSRARADQLAVTRLECVRVAVGELAAINPELLRAAWKFVTSESADRDVSLEIVPVAAREVCPQCGAIPEKPAHLLFCERCKCHMRVESGEEIDLLEIRFQQELAFA